jgi:hypothetical protein
MKIVSALLAVAMLVGVNQAFAQKKKALIDQVSGQGYGMAGCGAGSLVFADKPGIVQIFAGTTNAISGNQTFGISTGTLNCGESGKMAKSEQFIETNKMALMNEMARGQGESLASLSRVLDCKNNNFSTEMTKNYQQAFPQGGATSEQLSAVAYKSCQI